MKIKLKKILIYYFKTLTKNIHKIIANTYITIKILYALITFKFTASTICPIAYIFIHVTVFLKYNKTITKVYLNRK
jgi:hypothetical protein